MHKAVVIYNPHARNAPRAERLEACRGEFRGKGWEVEIRRTEAALHASELATEAARAGVEVVVACGGDGTINEVVNGLVGSESALALVRGGMGNVFAKEVGIPRKPADALKVLLDGERHRFDLGKVNDRYFLVMAGVGFDASVVRAVPDGPKRLLGSTSYALWGLRELAMHYRSHGTLLKLDGEEFEARLYWLLLGNTRSYGGIINVTAEARVDDGLLDAYLFEGHSPQWLADMTWRLALHRQDGGRGVSFRRVHELEVLSRGLPVQIDGEYFGETPAKFTTVPSALDVLLPRGRGAELFGAAPSK